MAVEIPVYVDVEGAFKQAASNIPQAIKPLQEVISQNALYIQVKIDGKKLYIKEVLDDSTLSARQLNQALEQINLWISNRAKQGGFDLLGGLTQSEKIHLEALGALEHRLNGVSDASALMARIYSANIERTQVKIQELSASIDNLTRKQNQYYKTINGKRVPGGKAYDRTRQEIEAANSELRLTKSYLASLTVELDKITNAGNRAATSVSFIRTSAMEMADAWRRGSTYIAQWEQGLGKANLGMGALLKNSAQLFALHAVTRFAHNVREVTSEFEMQRVALGGIIQDTERAESLFRQLKAAAIKSPFEIKELTSFTKQLSAYRIETDKLFDVTMRLADISAGLGVDMSRLVLAYGQVRAASVLRGQELRQFTEAGIPLVDELAKKFRELGREGTTTADVFELISKRAVPFSMIEDIFNDMTNAGGMFYKMQEKQSETLKGQWMKLKDALSIMYDEIGNTSTVHGAMETLLRDAMALFQNWREVGKTIGIVVASMTAYKIAVVNARIAQNALTAAQVKEISLLELNVVGKSRLIAALVGESAATRVQVTLSNLYVKAKIKEMMATNLFTKSLYKMVAALLANPYAAAIAGITALVGIIFRLSVKTNEARISYDNFKKSIESFSSSSSHANDIDELCDKYEELSSKTEKTKEETEKLIKVSKELAKNYPSAVNGVDSHTKAIKLNTDAIRENNKETREAIRLALEQDKNRAQGSLDDLIEERDKILASLEAGGHYESYGMSRSSWFIPLTEEEKADYGRRLLELSTQIKDFGDSIKEADDNLSGFTDDLIGPKLPEFWGNAWKIDLDNYKVMLKSTETFTKAFTSEQIESFGDQREALQAAAKEYETQTALIEFYTRALITATGERRKQTQSALEDAQALQGLYKAILDNYNAANLVKSKPGGSKGSYTQDPFIAQMQERMKFMQDFKKGYDDFNKYISKSDALAQQAKIMRERGLALGIDPSEQAKAAENLSEWYKTAIDKAFAQAKTHGATGTVESFLSQQISDTSKNGKALKDFQKLIQSLWDARTDIDTSKKKKEFEDALKALKDEIKRTETARNFYQDILDLTGDEQLAATMGISVYGDIGQEFKDRLQKQLQGVMTEIGASNLSDELRQAFKDQDFEVLLKNIDQIPEEYRDVIQQMASDSQKFNADRVKDLLKALQRSKTYADQQVALAKQTAQRTAQIQSLTGIDKATRERLLEDNARKEAEESAKIAYEAFKDTPMYVEMFSDLDAASLRMLTNMRHNIEQMKDSWKDLSPQELKELQSRMNELDEQIARRNPFKALSESLKEYRALQQQKGRKEAENEAIAADKKLQTEEALLQTYRQEYLELSKSKDASQEQVDAAKAKMESQAKAVDAAKEEAEAAQDSAYAYKQAAKHITDAAESMEEWAGYVTDALGGIEQIVDTFGGSDLSDTFGVLSEGLGKTMSGAAGLATGIGQLFAGDPRGIANAIKGIGDVISGTFGTASELKAKSLDKQIEKQTDLIEDLGSSYDRLENAMSKAFGSDYIYNYNQQLEVLKAQADAYQKQADLERKKGKKADEATAKGYEKSAQEVLDQIEEMQGKLSEFFSGTDLTSAARDFAQAWIEAYKEFGSTTTAMQEKFNDMIENMVVNSLAAKLIQGFLKPIFDQIDAASQEGDLTAARIGEITAGVPAVLQQIDAGMGTLMSQLTTAGINLRTQAGQFTGTSRDIAGASEESILGLSAGINTANFYMSHLPAIAENVAALRAYIVGDSAETVRTTASEGPTYEDQMLGYAANLPLMRDDMYAVRSLLEKVIKPVGSTYAVSVR